MYELTLIQRLDAFRPKARGDPKKKAPMDLSNYSDEKVLEMCRKGAIPKDMWDGCKAELWRRHEQWIKTRLERTYKFRPAPTKPNAGRGGGFRPGGLQPETAEDAFGRLKTDFFDAIDEILAVQP